MAKVGGQTWGIDGTVLILLILGYASTLLLLQAGSPHLPQFPSPTYQYRVSISLRPLSSQGYPFLLALQFPIQFFLPIFCLVPSYVISPSFFYLHLPTSILFIFTFTFVLLLPPRGERQSLYRVRPVFFQAAGHDTLVGHGIHLVGHEINLKGHDQNFVLNGIK